MWKCFFFWNCRALYLCAPCINTCKNIELVFCLITYDNSGTGNRNREGLGFPTNWIHGLGCSVSLVSRLWAGYWRIDVQFSVWTESCLFTVGCTLSLGLIEPHIHWQCFAILQTICFESNQIYHRFFVATWGITYKTAIYFQFYLTHLKGDIYLS